MCSSDLYQIKYPGLVSNALFLTIGCLLAMLVLYRTRLIRVGDKFRSILLSATIAIALTYLVDIVIGFFGHTIPFINDGSSLGIAFSLLVVGIAAFNLLLDFDLIEKLTDQDAPQYMEWYAGFALLVTIVWLYLEILRLLAKLNRK